MYPRSGFRFSRFAVIPSRASLDSNSNCCSSRSRAQAVAKAHLESRLHRAFDAADRLARLVRRRELTRVFLHGIGEAPARQRRIVPHLVDETDRLRLVERHQPPVDRSSPSPAPCRRAARAAACRRSPAARRAPLPAGRFCRPSFFAMRMSAAIATSRPPPTVWPFSAAMTSLRRLLEAVHRLVRVQAEVILERRIGVFQHADVRAGAEELLAGAADHDRRAPRRPCARRAAPRRSRASSRTSTCLPADRSARSWRRRPRGVVDLRVGHITLRLHHEVTKATKCESSIRAFVHFAVSPGFSSSTSTPFGSTSSRSASGVPVRNGKVPKCIGTTCLHAEQVAARAAPSGPIVNRSPIGRNAIAGLVHLANQPHVAEDIRVAGKVDGQPVLEPDDVAGGMAEIRRAVRPRSSSCCERHSPS